MVISLGIIERAMGVRGTKSLLPILHLPTPSRITWGGVKETREYLVHSVKAQRVDGCGGRSGLKTTAQELANLAPLR